MIRDDEPFYIPVCVLYPKEMNPDCQKHICPPMFIAVIITIAKNWTKPKYSLTDRQIKIICYRYTLKYYSTKKNEILIFVGHG
jgi:hypothetical protein